MNKFSDIEGIKTPNADLAEICWWSKNMFEDDFQEEGGDRKVTLREKEVYDNSDTNSDNNSDNSDHSPLQLALKRVRTT